MACHNIISAFLTFLVSIAKVLLAIKKASFVYQHECYLHTQDCIGSFFTFCNLLASSSALQVGATTSLNLVVEDKLVSCCYQQALKCNQDAYLCADPTHLLLVVVTFILVSKESKTQSSFQATLLLPSQSYDCSDIMTAARPFRSLKK